MRSRAAAATAVLFILSVTAVACDVFGGADKLATSCGRMGWPNLPAYTVSPNVQIDSPVLKRAQRSEKLVIGSKNDQPFLACEDADGNRSGFDIEVAKMVAADLGFSSDQIEFRTVRSSTRELAISKGHVDLYVGTYTINEERKEKVGFAGPYFVAGADLLVRMTDMSIDGPLALKGKRVCSVTGSTSLQEIKKTKYGAMAVERPGYLDCVRQLLDEKIDAVTTDDAILMGLAAQHPLKLRVVGAPFTKEPYGIGMRKGDEALRDAVNDSIEVHLDNGDIKRAFLATLGQSGSQYPTSPLLERSP
ncbi:glutamate ABC transporter substrate-binding protein [Streptomyces wuyuanensis]|uniref:glutamate ABC transporter substrate-binding protein n=1 Tax=Streptomyces wuyuanensis TaxID=1196353 RepID=UPI0034204C08